jgi:hypothetical protein
MRKTAALLDERLERNLTAIVAADLGDRRGQLARIASRHTATGSFTVISRRTLTTCPSRLQSDW